MVQPPTLDYAPTRGPLDCPHCGKQALGWLKKACLGPALKATCRCCGRKFGLAWKQSSMLMLPVAVLAATAPIIGRVSTDAVLKASSLSLSPFTVRLISLLVMSMLMVTTFVIFTKLYVDRVPLVKR